MCTEKDKNSQCTQTNLAEAQLIERCQGGEASAFDVLVHRYQDSVYRLVRRYMKNHEDARDVTQDVFIRAYKALPRFKRTAQFYTWLYRIAVNCCIDAVRRNQKHNVVMGGLEPDELGPIGSTTVPAPSKRAENKELFFHIQQAMAQLSPMQRETFILRYYDGLSLKAIAHKLNRTTGTIKSHLFCARERLQNELRPYVKGDPPADRTYGR